MQTLQAHCLTLHVTVVEALQGSSSVGVFAEVQQVSSFGLSQFVLPA